MKWKSAVFFGAIACTVCLIACADSNTYDNEPGSTEIEGVFLTKEEGTLNELEEEKKINIELDIEDYYITNTGDPSNLYHIDEEGVLWGCGRNNYAQLGMEQDYSFYEDMQKIAENVIHVDFSQTGYVIFLTADHQLYGLGNAGCGALQQYKEFDWMKYIGVNAEHYTVSEPCLLMENVIYARCGRSDVACITEDSSVWIFGTVGFDAGTICYSQYPVKILENAVLITGGFFNHAALLVDGSVWTWGYNYSGNCGVAGGGIISEPAKAAENAVMVWTGSIKYNTDCNDIAEFGGEYERGMENTIILTDQGEYLICGAYVGTEEKVLPVYYETSNYSMKCTYEFLPLNQENYQGPVSFPDNMME